LVDVLISTAGPGFRMQSINPDLHKTLLPFEGTPILTKIIENIPLNYSIGILLGYKSQQIISYLRLAHPDRDFNLIYVDDWTSDISGTGYSLKFAEHFVKESFWYFPCDGIFTNTNFFQHQFNENVCIVSKEPTNYTLNYLTFQISNNRVKSKFFKIESLRNVVTFTGVMFVKNKDDFFNQLRIKNPREFVDLIPLGSLTYLENSWMDLGNVESYNNHKSNSFDFSKPNEQTFLLSTKVIKWWADPQIPIAKLNKPKEKSMVFPSNLKIDGHFLSYDLEPGNPYYEHVNPSNFKDFLDWLTQNVWSVSELEIEANLNDFYKIKTLQRIELLGSKKELASYTPKYVDGLAVKKWDYYLENMNWELLINNPICSFLHGDLQFDNVVFNDSTKKFTLIDWRHDFSGLDTQGDLYYDFAKLVGGMIINYQDIKRGNLNYSLKDDNFEVTIEPSPYSRDLISLIKERALKLELNIDKINLLVPIIFWNMAPLHSEPFSNICWAMGLKYFEKNAVE
jgi:CTP:phosphocholine cytidylyltransferase-like protein